MKIPEQALQQHIAVLGKTGSGKTSTAKLAIEQVVAAGARVCILDPIKSDWWGLTSSADGTKPGLPFQILGGPHGHVPLHSSAGKAVGELVARGELRESIIDMADFEPGGQAKFFTEFAPALLRAMRGVVYLVIEEAHLFAPKEKSGLGSENLSIHWAKTIATAGRSKGIRLVLVTQRTQSLHNALLGSCETLIAHRFTAPADQEPVLKWLKANVDAEVYREVAGSLSSLGTGEGWLCSGEAKIFERMQFPRIHTYDNSATPTDDMHRATVATAPVDRAALVAILGKAVEEASATDPKAMRERIKELEAELAADDELGPGADLLEEARREGFAAGAASMRAIVERIHTLAAGTSDTAGGAIADLERFEARAPIVCKPIGIQKPDISRESPHKVRTNADKSGVNRAESAEDAPAKRRIMIAMAQNPEGISARKLAILADVKRGGSTWRAAMAALRKDGHLAQGGPDTFAINAAGLKALGKYEPLPSGGALRDHWRGKMSTTRLALFDAILEAYPKAISPAAAAQSAGVELGGSTWRAHMANLRGLELVSGGRTELRANPDLFQ